MTVFAVTALIRKEDRILAVSRRDKPHRWGLPGGKLESGEDPYEALVREVKEETNLDVQEASKVFSRSINNKDVYCYYVNDWVGIPSQQEDGVKVKWVKPADLVAGPFGAWNVKLFDHIGIQYKPAFTYHVIWSSKHGEFLGTCDQFPELVSYHSDPDYAWQGIRNLVEGLG